MNEIVTVLDSEIWHSAHQLAKATKIFLGSYGSKNKSEIEKIVLNMPHFAGEAVISQSAKNKERFMQCMLDNARRIETLINEEEELCTKTEVLSFRVHHRIAKLRDILYSGIFDLREECVDVEDILNDICGEAEYVEELELIA